jgi:hypothetical protein
MADGANKSDENKQRKLKFARALKATVPMLEDDQ